MTGQSRQKTIRIGELNPLSDCGGLLQGSSGPATPVTFFSSAPRRSSWSGFLLAPAPAAPPSPPSCAASRQGQPRRCALSRCSQRRLGRETPSSAPAADEPLLGCVRDSSAKKERARTGISPQSTIVRGTRGASRGPVITCSIIPTTCRQQRAALELGAARAGRLPGSSAACFGPQVARRGGRASDGGGRRASIPSTTWPNTTCFPSVAERQRTRSVGQSEGFATRRNIRRATGGACARSAGAAASVGT